MWHGRRRVLCVRASAIVAGMLTLAGCGGEESDVPEQVAPVRVEATGIVTDGAHARSHIIAGRGTAGIARTSRTADSGEYTLSLTDLSGPYLFSNTLSPDADPGLMLLTTVATRAGVAHLTPLTTLLTAQVLGLSPGDAIVSFNDRASVDPARITEAGIRAAQADLTAYLQDVYGIQVKTGTASFIDSAFAATTGDAMYDTIQALNARLAENGSTLKALAEQIATGARACFTEELSVVVNGRQKKLCPIFKSALPEEADTTILAYVFRSISNESITLRVRGDSVLGGEYVATDGAAFTCDGAGCGSISLGAPSEDETRPILFTGAALTGTAGTALATGTLVGAVPGITLPTLPCVNNRFFVIFEDRSVIADCVSANDPLNIGGTFGGVVGPGREGYTFINGTAPRLDLPRFEIVLDYDTPEPTVVSVFYVDNDPDTGVIRNRFACQTTACNGATVGPVAVNTSAGFPIEVVPVTLDDTVLTGFNEDGSTTGATVAVRASLVALRDPSQVVTYPPLADCASEADTILARAASAEFNLCVPHNDLANGFIYRTAADLGNGDIQLSLSSDAGDQVVVNLHNDVLVEALLSLASTGEQFRCSTDCVGVSISAADAAGERTVSFANVSLRRVQSFPLPGDRTLSLSSGGLVLPPP
jgi:hypothetical protein